MVSSFETSVYGRLGLQQGARLVLLERRFEVGDGLHLVGVELAAF